MLFLRDRCSLVPETVHPAQAANVMSPDPAPIVRLTKCSYIGVPPSGVRDGCILGPRHTSPPHHQAQAVCFHLGEPNYCQAAIWIEGTLFPITNPKISGQTANLAPQITFIFILILFIDSVNRVYRVQQELSAFTKDGPGMG